MPLPTQPLAEQIHHAIHTHPHLRQKMFHYEERQGRVTLQGTVSSYFQKQMAQEALRKIDGIQEIDNRLEVVWH